MKPPACFSRSLAAVAAAALLAACADPVPPAVPTTVTVSPSTADLAALGETVQLTATVKDQNGNTMTDVAVTWSSGVMDIATVNERGLVTAAGNGQVSITAKAGAASGDAAVTVDQVPATVTLAPGSLAFSALMDTATLEATVADANGHAIEGAAVSWTSGDDAVARVGQDGLVTSAGNGETAITAASGDLSATVAVAVEQVLATITLSPAADTLVALGDSLPLAAEAMDANGHVVAGVRLAWSSGDTSVVTVDQTGLVRAVGNGTAAVTAATDSVTGRSAITVSQSATTVTVSPASDTVFVGDSLQLVAEASDANGNLIRDAVFAWESSNDRSAQVDDSGLVIGRFEEGTATVTATSGRARGSSEITVYNPDRSALEKLYHATGGSDWNNNGGWLTDAPVNEWHGVTVHPASGRVVRRGCPNRSWRLRWLPGISCYDAISFFATGVVSSSRCALRIQRSR